MKAGKERDDRFGVENNPPVQWFTGTFEAHTKCTFQVKAQEHVQSKEFGLLNKAFVETLRPRRSGRKQL